MSVLTRKNNTSWFKRRPFSSKRSIVWWVTAMSMLLLFYWSLPGSLFNTPYATIITDRNDNLLAGHIAADGQWRFPPGDSVPEKFKTALIHFEDAYFYYHPGINPFSLVRALKQNIRAQKTVSGGSTLTMQVIRLARPAPRTLPHKVKEMFLAFRLEVAISKDSILALYAAQAPFGGNTVGLEAASWRYFNHPPHELTWAEAALLAVLPNAPALVHPGRNRQQLLEKRNRLLTKLHQNSIIDSLSLQLALAESLPAEPRPIPRLLPHLLDARIAAHPGTRIKTSIDPWLQQLSNDLINRHAVQLKQNQIFNAAALILSVETGEVLAYIGNTQGNDPSKGHQVDIIRAPRSSGSILKPLLFGAALQDGLILPKTLLPDIPTYYKNFNPQNYQKRHDGAVPADEALSRSLNVPFVRLLNDYGGERFLALLQQCGFSTIQKPYTHYGLSLILGGAETTLWDLAGCYASMSRTLNHYTSANSIYYRSDFHPATTTWPVKQHTSGPANHAPVFQASAIYQTFLAMTGVQRPPEETGWEHFTSSRPIAWKTGTSYGFRDAWSIGVTPEYVVAVWVGNATGEGRPGIIGGATAGPILFELFNLLPPTSRFQPPYDDLIQVPVCRLSGHRAGPSCEPVDSVFIPATHKKTTPCAYHQRIHVTPDARYQTRIDCEPSGNIRTINWFVLPPVIEWFYKPHHPDYASLPPFKPGCDNHEGASPIDFIYPPANTTVFVPRDLSGQLSRIVLKAVHPNSQALLHWHFNGQYLGATTAPHQFEVLPRPGINTITVVDEEGNRLLRRMNCAGE